MNKIKTLLFLISLFTFSGVFSQALPYDSVQKKLIYTEVVQVPGADAAKLYDRAMAGLNILYKDLATKLTTNDKTNGKVVLKHFDQLMLKDPKTGVLYQSDLVKFNITIMMKEGRYKFEITNFTIDRGIKFPIEKYITKDDPYYDYKKERADEKLACLNKDILAILVTLKDSMSKDVTKTKEDW